MPEPPSSPPKRHLEQRPPQESWQPQSKRQKLKHPRGPQIPEAFWNNLSKIWLTKNALKELDRRNTETALSARRLLYRRPYRPVTRYTVIEWENKEENWEHTRTAVDFLTSCSARHLEDIKPFARHGGPDLSNLRGYQKTYHTMNLSQWTPRGRKPSSETSSDTKPTPKTRKIGPYDRNFQQNLVDYGVHPHHYEYPDGHRPAKPNNWKEIQQRLVNPRPSLSLSKFSEEEYEQFLRADAYASKEHQVTKSVIPIIEGDITDGKCVSGNIMFKNLNHLTDGTLVPGNPDLYYGARPEQLNRQVRTELSDQIIPSTQDNLPITPNFFLAVKGPDGSTAVAERQASYDGALGARGIHSLQSYRQDKPAYDNNAYVVTSTYHSGQIKIFTSHPAQPNGLGSQPEYYITQLRSFAMTNNAATFRQGATVFRNARDWAKEQRDKAIMEANKKVNS